MFRKFLPKQKKFFEILAELCENALEGAKLLNRMIVEHSNLDDYSSKIHLLEHKCDDITHKVIYELNETFITPIDREDIHLLTNSLDNIIDSIDSIGIRINLYNIKSPIAFGQQLSGILLSQVELLLEIVKNLKNRDRIFEKLVSIRDLETQGDVVFRQAITNLFEHEKDVIEIIKKKELLEEIERAVDNCQTAAIVVEGIMIKNV